MMLAIESRPVPDETWRPWNSGSVAPAIAGAQVWPSNRESCFLDSPHGFVDVVAPFWWSGNADSSSAVLAPALDISRDDSHGLVSTAEQMALVVRTLSFSKRQLADVFGVSRQAIYDWIKGENVSEENADRLSRLAELVAEISPGSWRPLHHRFTTRPLVQGEPSLLDLLRAEAWDEDKILAQLLRAEELTAQQATRKGSKRNASVRGRPNDNLSDNLLSLGEG